MPDHQLVFSNRTTASLDIVSFYAYLIEGFFLMLVNMYIGLIIFGTKNLRSYKEYVIIGSNILFDAYFGLAYFVSGVYSLDLYYRYEYLPLLSKWECYLTYQSLIVTVSGPSVGWNAFFTCLDRLYSVLFPIEYLMLPTKYAYSTPILALIFTFPMLILFGISSYELRERLYTEPALCDLENTGSTQVYQAYRGTRIACSLICVVMFAPIIYRTYKIAKNSNQNSGISYQQKQRLVRMTKTVLLISLNEVVLFAIPDLYLLLNPTNTLVIPYVMNMNRGVINLIIFMRTQKELRKTIYEKTCIRFKKTSSIFVAAKARLSYS